ncbi:CDP-glucose 4,6-dehydratase [Candidatus Pelagibacter bacterium]|jgi:CDP-glucose 4,6-dehydratase|nr:CDP-glucose 4,6-dehydratase [Candidatus Pelagibacter bacterium]
MFKKLELFRNKKIIITGHNGFKGSWLTIWLSLFGAKLVGISLKNNSKDNHFNLVKKKIKVKSYYFDIRNKKKLQNVILKEQPDYIFHLAAQSLVFKSILDVSYNWETNVLGLLNLLESISKMKKKCYGIIITSDKCYKNLEQIKGYKETDILGGIDPYSASKASAEILFHSYFKTFIINKKKNIRLCTARAGNVIGGGDWSNYRLIPDCMKMWLSNKKPIIRNPNSTRPWQHVLEALSGYLTLAIELTKNEKINGSSFNFSSDKIKNITVINFLKKIYDKWPNVKWKIKNSNKFYESSLLQLNSTKANKILNWKAKLNINETIDFVVEWYKNFNVNKQNTFLVSREQIIKFMKKKI